MCILGYLAGGEGATKIKFILQKNFFLKNTFEKKKFTVPKFFIFIILKLSSKIRPRVKCQFLCSCFKYKLNFFKYKVYFIFKESYFFKKLTKFANFCKNNTILK